MANTLNINGRAGFGKTTLLNMIVKKKFSDRRIYVFDYKHHDIAFLYKDMNSCFNNDMSSDEDIICDGDIFIFDGFNNKNTLMVDMYSSLKMRDDDILIITITKDNTGQYSDVVINFTDKYLFKIEGVNNIFNLDSLPVIMKILCPKII